MPRFAGPWIKGAAALALLASTAVPAAAGPIPILWSYTSSGSGYYSTGFQSGGFTMYGLLDQQRYGTKQPIDGSVTLNNLYSVSAGFYDFTPNGAQGRNFTIDLVIKDIASGQSADFSFAGYFPGGYYFVDVYPVFTSPLTQSAQLGFDTYTVTERGSGGGGILTDPNTALLEHITMDVAVSNTPEPATLTLAGLGLAGVVAARWRRRAAQH